jgi:hypothetical protein
LIERQPARWNGDLPQQARANGDHQRPASEGPPRRPALSMAGEGNNHFYQGVFHSVEVEMLMARRVTCIECGDALPEERAELGYDYCTNAECQAVHRRGLTITTVGVNKSADAVIVADPDEIRRRGEAGEFGKKDTALGVDYRRSGSGAARRTAPRPPAPPRSPAGGRWTPQQEQLVRLYHDMGMSPRQIAERARQNAPRLGVTERLVVQILSSPPRR